MRTFVDELDFIMRLLVPGLYMRPNVTKIRPAPGRFATATSMALEDSEVPAMLSKSAPDHDIVMSHMHARNKAAEEPNMPCDAVVAGLSQRLDCWGEKRIKKALKHNFQVKAMDFGGGRMANKAPAEHWALNSLK